MKKILITNKNLNIGGSEIALVNLLNNLDYNFFEVDLLIFSEKSILKEKIPQQVNIIDAKKEFNYPYKLLQIIFKIDFLAKRLVRKKISKKYDYAIAFNGYNNITDLIAAFANAEKKYIWVHSDYSQKIQKLSGFKSQFQRMKNKFKYFDKIICVSKGSAKSFSKLLPEYNNIEVCYNIIDEKEIHDKINSLTNITLEGDTKIISLGRLVKDKGFDRFIRILNRLDKENSNKNIRGYIIGEGPERKPLEELIKEKKLEQKVFLLGEQRNPFPILKQADIYLLTSQMEGFGLVIIEALICNLPVILPKIASAEEIYNEIAPANSIVLVENNEEDLYRGLVKAINNEISFDFSIAKYNQIARKHLKSILK